MNERPHCTAYFAISLDGFIADAEGGVGWLDAPSAGLDDDMGFIEFMAGIDAVLMGRVTFQQVLGFGAWPYTKPVFVLSNSLTDLPTNMQAKATLASGSPHDLLHRMGAVGHNRLYIDGGATVESFLAEDLIDRMVMTMIPTLLGSGIRIFGPLTAPLHWTQKQTRVLGERLVQVTYDRSGRAST